MSAVPSQLAFEEDPGSGRGRLSRTATLYLVAIAGVAALIALPFVPRLQTEHRSPSVWAAFGLLAAGAALAQMLLVKTPRNQSYHATNVFLVPAVLLLPPELVVLVAVVQHIPAWLKTRPAWYVEFFNICDYVIATLAAWGTAHVILDSGGLVTNSELRFALFDRPLSLIMADLDLLRDINNTYGHLAGDAVLKGIADVFRTHLRHYDVPARFGGEEFSILLPETSAEEAFEIAERIRHTVSERAFDVETSSQPIRATVSIGIATFPRDGHDANELIHQADLAVYRAKLQGRNRVLDATSEPLAVPVDRKPRLVAMPETSDHL